jgi:hypothetical protein
MEWMNDMGFVQSRARSNVYLFVMEWGKDRGRKEGEGRCGVEEGV